MTSPRGTGATERVGREEMKPEWEIEFDKKTNYDIAPSNEIHDISKWLKEYSEEHLFEDEIYGEPMLDLSVDKVKDFVREKLAEQHQHFLSHIDDVVKLYPAFTVSMIKALKDV